MCEQLIALRKQFLARPPQEEINWLATADPAVMLAPLRSAGVRKARLFGIACCRRVWHLMDFDDCRDAVQLAERLVEGEATPRQAHSIKVGLRQTYNNDLNGSWDVRTWSQLSALRVLTEARGSPPRPDEELLKTFASVQNVVVRAVPPGSLDAEQRAQAELIREVIGNPYRPVSLLERWRTPDVLALAESAYAERAFDRLPILADALEEAGCASAELLEHLRLRGTAHVRGCWALDLVLGKQ